MVVIKAAYGFISSDTPGAVLKTSLVSWTDELICQLLPGPRPGSLDRLASHSTSAALHARHAGGRGMSQREGVV